MAKLTDEASTSTVPQAMLDSVQALEELSARGSRGEGSAEGWTAVAERAKTIADALRTEDLRVALGETTLLSSCGSLLRLSLVAGRPSLGGKTELLRVVGNMCFDNDANRKRTHAAAVPASILQLLSEALGLLPVEEVQDDPRSGDLSLDELKFLRAATGALLNMSLKYDPIREELLASSSISVLLGLLDSRTDSTRTVNPVYTVGSWAAEPVDDVDKWKTELDASSTIATWAMNILEDILAGDKNAFPEDGISILASVILSISHSVASPSASLWTPEEVSDHIDTDLELLTTAATLLEALSIDLETAKQELGFALYTDKQPILGHLMTFVENASSPSYWSAAGEEQEPAALDKAFSTVKSAVVRAIVEAPNSDLVMNQLFAVGQGKSWVVERLVKWVEESKDGREDMLICAAHMLAALGRKDEHCVSLVHEYGIAPPLGKIAIKMSALQFEKATNGARPGEVTQILFGVVSLLRHLSIPVVNKAILGDTGIIGPVSTLLQRELDIVGPLQNAAVGLLKHLTAANVPNSLRLLEAPSASQEDAISTTNSSPTALTSPFDFVLALIPRTDDVRLRSEATRIVVNVVRTLFSTKPLGTGADLAHASPITPTLHSAAPNGLDAEETMKRRGRPLIVRKEVAEALSEMVRLSERYPMLINEAVVGLTLLAGSGGAGAVLVLDALLTAHAPPPAPPADAAIDPLTGEPAPSRTASLAISPAGDPPCSSDMLTNWLGLCASSQLATTASAPPTAVRPEMIGNACAMLITVLRGAEVAKADRTKVDELRGKVVGPLKGCAEVIAEEKNEGLKRTVVRCLEVVEA